VHIPLQQEGVALAQWNFELLGKVKEHFATWHRAPRLKKAQVTGRDVGFTSKVKLAEATSSSPITQQIADRLSLNGIHKVFRLYHGTG
jgi:hypothetical protein